MTELQEYKNKYFDDKCYDFPKPSKRLAEEWLDAKIEVMEQIRRISQKQGYNLIWGDFREDTGDFQYEVQTCYLNDPLINGVQIYQGIDKLAEIMGAELEEVHEYDEYDTWRYSFSYKGYKVFQIGSYRYEKFYDGKDGMRS